MNESGRLCTYPVTFTRQSVKTMFTLFAVFWWIGYPLTFVFVGIPLLIAAIVFDSIILYWHWLLLQGYGARTTPGEAVGFSFIPFFCCYWWFVAYAGLAQDNNRYMNEAGIASPYLSYRLAVAICVLGIAEFFLGWIPVVGVVLAIPSSIIGFIFVLQQKDCILAIMSHRQIGA